MRLVYFTNAKGNGQPIAINPEKVVAVNPASSQPDLYENEGTVIHTDISRALVTTDYEETCALLTRMR